jgi:hypothetical protein
MLFLLSLFEFFVLLNSPHLSFSFFSFFFISFQTKLIDSLQLFLIFIFIFLTTFFLFQHPWLESVIEKKEKTSTETKKGNNGKYSNFVRRFSLTKNRNNGEEKNRFESKKSGSGKKGKLLSPSSSSSSSLLTPSCLPLPLSLSSTPSTTSPFAPPFSSSSSPLSPSLSLPITSSSILSYLSPNSMENISIRKERDKEKSLTEKRTKTKEKSTKIKEKEMENDAIAFPFSSVSLSECRSEESGSRKAFRAGEGAHSYHSIRKSIHRNACDNVRVFENEKVGEEKKEEEVEEEGKLEGEEIEEEEEEGEDDEERQGDGCLLRNETSKHQNDNNNENKKDGERENDENEKDEKDGDGDEVGMLANEIHFQRQFSATISCDEEKDEDNQLDYNNLNNLKMISKNDKNSQNSQNNSKTRILNDGNLNELLGGKTVLNKFNLSKSGNCISRKNLIYGHFSSNEYYNEIDGNNINDNNYFYDNKSGAQNENENEIKNDNDNDNDNVNVNHINNKIKNSNINDKRSNDMSLFVLNKKCDTQGIGAKENETMVKLKIDLRDEKGTHVRTDKERVGERQIDLKNNNCDFHSYDDNNDYNLLDHGNCDSDEKCYDKSNSIDILSTNNNDNNNSNNDYDDNNSYNNKNININNSDNNDKKINFDSNMNSYDESTLKIKNDYDYRIESKKEIISNEKNYNTECEFFKNNNSNSKNFFQNKENSSYNDNNNEKMNSEGSFYCKGELNSNSKILNFTFSNLIESDVEKEVVLEKEEVEKSSFFCDSEVGDDSSVKIKIDLKSVQKATAHENGNEIEVVSRGKGGNENDLNFVHENVTRKNENVDNKFENKDRKSNDSNNDSHNNDNTSNNNYNNISNNDCAAGIEHNITMMKYKESENFIKNENNDRKSINSNNDNHNNDNTSNDNYNNISNNDCAAGIEHNITMMKYKKSDDIIKNVKTEKIVDDSQNWQNSRDFIPKQKSVKSHKSEITEFNNPNLGIKYNLAQEENLRLLNFSLSKAEKIFLGGSEKGSDSWRESRNRSGKNNNNNSSFMSSGYVLQKNLKNENRIEVENNGNKSMKAKIRNLVKIGEIEGGTIYNTIIKNDNNSNNDKLNSKLSEYENINRSDKNTETVKNETSDFNGNENRDFEIDSKNTDFLDVHKTINLKSINKNDEIKASISNKIRSGRSYGKECVVVSDRNPEWPTKSTKVYESG